MHVRSKSFVGLYHCGSTCILCTTAKPLARARKTHGPGCWILESRHPSENPIVRRVSEISAREILTTRCVDSLPVYLTSPPVSTMASCRSMHRRGRSHSSAQTSRSSSRSQGQGGHHTDSHMAAAAMCTLCTPSPQTVQPFLLDADDALSGVPPSVRLVSPLALRCIGGFGCIRCLATTAFGALGCQTARDFFVQPK
jgi:hypothetical protein